MHLRIYLTEFVRERKEHPINLTNNSYYVLLEVLSIANRWSNILPSKMDNINSYQLSVMCVKCVCIHRLKRESSRINDLKTFSIHNGLQLSPETRHLHCARHVDKCIECGFRISNCSRHSKLIV